MTRKTGEENLWCMMTRIGAGKGVKIASQNDTYFPLECEKAQ